MRLHTEDGRGESDKLTSQAPSQAELDKLEAQLRLQLKGCVRQLRLSSLDRGLVLHGQTETYYAKELAQQALKEASKMIAADARAAVASRGRFVMAVSGGRTPWQMLRALASEDVPWNGVQVVQVDERIAPAGVNPIWGITAMLSACEPIVKNAALASRGVIRNTAIGCVVGLVFVVFGRGLEWSLPIALMATDLLSMYVLQVKVMWQHAPLTAAIVIAANIADPPDVTPFEAGTKRVGEVPFGCVVGLGVSWFVSRLWPSLEPTETSSDTQNGEPSCV